MEKTESLCTLDGTINWCSHYGGQYGVPQKIKTRTTHDPEILLLGIFPKKMTPKYKRDLQCHVHYNIIHNSQVMKMN